MKLPGTKIAPAKPDLCHTPICLCSDSVPKYSFELHMSNQIRCVLDCAHMTRYHYLSTLLEAVAPQGGRLWLSWR